MNPPHRHLAAVAAVLLLASGAAPAVIVPSAQIALDTETPISDPVVASGTFAWNNGVGGDTASARAESTYGGDLKAESISTSAAPTSGDLITGFLEGFGTAAEALWYGEFAVRDSWTSKNLTVVSATGVVRHRSLGTAAPKAPRATESPDRA